MQSLSLISEFSKHLASVSLATLGGTVAIVRSFGVEVPTSALFVLSIGSIGLVFSGAASLNVMRGMAARAIKNEEARALAGGSGDILDALPPRDQRLLERAFWSFCPPAVLMLLSIGLVVVSP